MRKFALIAAFTGSGWLLGWLSCFFMGMAASKQLGFEWLDRHERGVIDAANDIHL